MLHTEINLIGNLHIMEIVQYFERGWFSCFYLFEQYVLHWRYFWWNTI